MGQTLLQEALTEMQLLREHSPMTKRR
jgi:hypothetical protein